MTKWNKIGYGFLAAAAIAMVGCSGISAYAAEDTTTESETTWNDEWTEEEIAYWDSLDWGILEEDIEQVDLSLGEPEELNAAGGTATLMGGATQTPGQWIFDQSAQKWWYRHNDGGYSTNAWELINGEWYYFDANGYMVTGWVSSGGRWYYCDSTGAMQTGWVLLNGTTYYFLNDGTDTGEKQGAMLTGWYKINGTWQYMYEKTGSEEGKWIDNTGTQMVSYALNYLGNPYVYGHDDLINGTDCSGYTQRIHAMVHISINRQSKDQYSGTNVHPVKSGLQPGDLVFYSNTQAASGIGHVAFYAGKISETKNGETKHYLNQVVHAAGTQYGIIYSSIDWDKRTQFYGTYWRQ